MARPRLAPEDQHSHRLGLNLDTRQMAILEREATARDIPLATYARSLLIQALERRERTRLDQKRPDRERPDQERGARRATEVTVPKSVGVGS